MSKYLYSHLLFNGRFEPFHAGHYSVVKKALSLSEYVIMSLGSDDAPRTSKNPFTTLERIEIIKTCFTEEELNRIHFLPQPDFSYNDDKWLVSVREKVNYLALNKPWRADPVKLGIIGRKKDHTSYYINMFPKPEYDHIDVSDYEKINATDIRRYFYEKIWNASLLKSHAPKLDDAFRETRKIEDCWFVNDNHRQIIINMFYKFEVFNSIEEYVVVEKGKKQWEGSPYPPIFVTVDAIVTQSAHILLIERGAMPGEGLWALPGGFLNQWERIEDGIIRELREETKLKVPDAVLRGSIRKNGIQIFDYPYRSQRGRTITHAALIELDPGYELPKVKGSDDAKKAKWFPLDQVKNMRSQMFEDHYDMISDMTGAF